MRALAKILPARAREHPSNFCEQFEQRPNFASTFKLDETILYPYIWEYPHRYHVYGGDRRSGTYTRDQLR